MNKLKKKINELFILGEITQEEADAMAAGEVEIPGTSKENDNAEKGMLLSILPSFFVIEDTPNDNNNLAEIAAINKKLTQARDKKQPGPMLNLTLERLGGSYLSHQGENFGLPLFIFILEIRDLVQYSVIGPVVNKPKWAFFRPWKATSQTVLLRVNCPNEYIVRNDTHIT